MLFTLICGYLVGCLELDCAADVTKIGVLPALAPVLFLSCGWQDACLDDDFGYGDFDVDSVRFIVALAICTNAPIRSLIDFQWRDQFDIEW